MKSIVILKTVSIPMSPGFNLGDQVRVSEKIAEMLVDRGFAKYENKDIEATADEKKRNEDSVSVKKTGVKRAS